MVGPGMFVGRGDEIRTVEKCLYQAKNGNPQHFLIQGERGIGKSSLFLYVKATAAQGRAMASGTTFDFWSCPSIWGEVKVK